MDEDKIRQFIEQLDPEGKLPSNNVEAFIEAVKEMEKNPMKDGETRGDYTFHTLKEQMEAETDWRKKAAIAAKIISLGLE